VDDRDRQRCGARDGQAHRRHVRGIQQADCSHATYIGGAPSTTVTWLVSIASITTLGSKRSTSTIVAPAVIDAPSPTFNE
jgi:hypothetical protein